MNSDPQSDQKENARPPVLSYAPREPQPGLADRLRAARLFLIRLVILVLLIGLATVFLLCLEPSYPPPAF